MEFNRLDFEVVGESVEGADVQRGGEDVEQQVSGPDAFAREHDAVWVESSAFATPDAAAVGRRAFWADRVLIGDAERQMRVGKILSVHAPKRHYCVTDVQ